MTRIPMIQLADSLSRQLKEIRGGDLRICGWVVGSEAEAIELRSREAILFANSNHFS